MTLDVNSAQKIALPVILMSIITYIVANVTLLLLGLQTLSILPLYQLVFLIQVIALELPLPVLHNLNVSHVPSIAQLVQLLLLISNQFLEMMNL